MVAERVHGHYEIGLVLIHAPPETPMARQVRQCLHISSVIKSVFCHVTQSCVDTKQSMRKSVQIIEQIPMFQRFQ